MRRRILTSAAVLTLCVGSSPAFAQTWAVDDPVLRQVWQQGMEQSQVMDIAQTLMDSIGPRLTGTPGFSRGAEWAAATMRSWGIDARVEQYGTWNGWTRGITHVDLVRPRVRSLDAMMLAWSPGTNGTVEAEVIALPEFASEGAFQAWLPNARGKVVAAAFPQPTCRPDDHYDEYGQSGARQRLQQSRSDGMQRFSANRPGGNNLRAALEAAGAAAILESGFQTLGVNRIFGTNTERTPTIDVGCEDYGLVYRLAANGQGPVVRITAEAEHHGEVPATNVIGVIRGTELPNEYVMLSAHFDSWDGASGATDNGTGSSMMLEVMRIIAETYPNPRRSILIGLWGGEEQGLNGSRRFAEMHPEIVDGIQILFNQDNGTGRISRVGMQGLIDVGGVFSDWLARIPQQVSSHVEVTAPGFPGSGGSDYASFICAGAPALGLSALNWGYSPYTWHTNRDTYDKIVPEEMRNNATLGAMLVYLASEHPEKLSRDRRVMGDLSWPPCRPGAQQSPRAGGSQ